MKTNMNSSSTMRSTLDTGLMAAAMVAALAGMAFGVCPPEEARAGADDVAIVDSGDTDALRVRLREVRPHEAITDVLVERPVVNIVTARGVTPRMGGVFASQPGATGVSSRTSVYNFKWTGKDAGSNAQVVQAEYKDGVWTVKVDGKDVPSERLSTENNELVVKDEAGKEIFRAPVQIDAKDRVTVVRNRLAVPRAGGLFGGQVAGSGRPRLGVTMNPVDEGIVEHLGLAEGEYAEISSVTPGSAAEEAGLKVKDVVVSIDGRTPASTEVVSEVIRGKSAGDKVKIKVIRKGQPVEVEATLKKSPAAESVEMQSMPGAMAMPEGQAKLSDLSDRLALPYKEMIDRAEKLSKEGALNAEKYKELVEKYGRLGDRFPVDGPGMKFAVPLGPDGEQRQIEVFTLPGEREKVLEDRLKVLEDRLKQMEELLRRLDARLGGAGVPVVPAVPAVPSTAPAAPGSGGGAVPPRMPRADGVENEMLTLPQ